MELFVAIDNEMEEQWRTHWQEQSGSADLEEVPPRIMGDDDVPHWQLAKPEEILGLPEAKSSRSASKPRMNFADAASVVASIANQVCAQRCSWHG